MDWLFGRKKSEVKVEDAKEVISQMADDFVMMPPYPNQHYGYPSLPNYNPQIPAVPPSNFPTQPISMNAQPSTSYKSVRPHQSPLDSVPFKLSSRLESKQLSSVPTDIKRVGIFLSTLKDSLNSSELNYDFSLERSVLRETNCFNGL